MNATLTAPTTLGLAAASAPPVAEVLAHRSYLVRFATRRLGDSASAEDAVQDVFEAYFAGRASFGGRAALRSWLTAVLKHKIVDGLRRTVHHETIDGTDDDSGDALAVACPNPRPDQIAEQREQLASTLAAIEQLPPTLRQAMQLRILEERSTESVCSELGISEENLFVRVHRARKQLLS